MHAWARHSNLGPVLSRVVCTCVCVCARAMPNYTVAVLVPASTPAPSPLHAVQDKLLRELDASLIVADAVTTLWLMGALLLLLLLLHLQHLVTAAAWVPVCAVLCLSVPCCDCLCLTTRLLLVRHSRKR